MGTKRRSNITIEWNDAVVMRQVGQIVDDVSLDTAERIKERAIRKLQTAEDETGNLAGQISLKVSKFRHGGYSVEAQGSEHGPYSKQNPYYASFLELGHHIRKTKKGDSVGYAQPFPYLRPAKNAEKRKFRSRLLAEIENL